jgi:hypothetical protein
MSMLNEFQRRAVLMGFLDLHYRMAEMEALLARADDSSPFSQTVPDLSPAEAETVRGHFARVRDVMLAFLRAQGIPVEVHRTGLRRALLGGLQFLSVAAAELAPKRLAGYGPVSPDGAAQVAEVLRDLNQLIDKLGARLRQGPGE